MARVRASQKAAFAAGLLAALIGPILLMGRAEPHDADWPAARLTRGKGLDAVVFPRPPRIPMPLDERLAYEFGWNGVPAATLRVSASTVTGKGRKHLVLEYEVKTLPVVDRIWPFQANGTTVMDARTLQPQVAKAATRAGSREKRISTRFDWEAGTAKVKIRKVRKNGTRRKRVKCPLGLDMPSAFMTLRWLELPQGGTGTVRLLNGDALYEVALTAAQTGTVEVRAGKFAATEYDLKVRRLTDGGRPRRSRGKYRGLRMWISLDRRMPLKIECEVFVGHVYAELITFEHR